MLLYNVCTMQKPAAKLDVFFGWLAFKTQYRAASAHAKNQHTGKHKRKNRCRACVGQKGRRLWPNHICSVKRARDFRKRFYIRHAHTYAAAAAAALHNVPDCRSSETQAFANALAPSGRILLFRHIHVRRAHTHNVRTRTTPRLLPHTHRHTLAHFAHGQ